MLGGGAAGVVVVVVVAGAAMCTTRTTAGGVPVGSFAFFTLGTGGRAGRRVRRARWTLAAESSSRRVWAAKTTGLTLAGEAAPSWVVRKAANAPATTANATASAITKAWILVMR